MKASFNVLEEPWIPVLDLQKRLHYVGVREVLIHGHKYLEISDPMPHIEYGLHRFLCALLMDILRPQDRQDLKEMLKSGRFDAEKLESYFAACQKEGVTFDLFDEKRPFLQTPYEAEWDKVKKPASNLDITIPNGNNHVHFDHRNNQDITFTYAQAARLLPALQIFCTAALQGYPSGVNGAPPYYTLVKGKNLFETLVYSFIPLEDIFQMPFDNPPVFWRCSDKVEAKTEVMQTSWLYGMLFPARRILLIPDAERECVAQIYLSQGLNYSGGNWSDPHVTYRINKNGKFPWRPNHTKAIWRNLCDLVGATENCAPKILVQSQYLCSDPLLDVLLYGVQTDQANYITMQRYDLQIAKALFSYPERVVLLQQCINYAEKLASALHQALNVETKKRSTGIPNSVCQHAEQQFYTICERHFWKLCNDLLAGEQVDLQACWDFWIGHIISAALKANEDAWKRMTLRAADLMNATKRQEILFAQIRKIKKVNET